VPNSISHWGNSQCSPRPIIGFEVVLLLREGKGTKKKKGGRGARENEEWGKIVSWLLGYGRP